MSQLHVAIVGAALCYFAPVIANDVFVPQMSPDRPPVLMQQSGNDGSVFIHQMPEDARPVLRQPRATAPAARTFVTQVFIAPHHVAGEKTQETAALVVNNEPGITPHGDGSVPALPNVGAGSTVVVTAPDAVQNIPTVGRGVVLL